MNGLIWRCFASCPLGSTISGYSCVLIYSGVTLPGCLKNKVGSFGYSSLHLLTYSFFLLWTLTTSIVQGSSSSSSLSPPPPSLPPLLLLPLLLHIISPLPSCPWKMSRPSGTNSSQSWRNWGKGRQGANGGMNSTINLSSLKTQGFPPSSSGLPREKPLALKGHAQCSSMLLFWQLKCKGINSLNQSLL